MQRVFRISTTVNRVITPAVIACCALACGTQGESSSDDATSSTMVATATGNDSMNADQGGGIPASYVAHLDRSSGNMAEVLYTADGTGRWEVRTGPSHILYSSTDTASGKYQVTTTIEQLVKPNHPEAYGLFIGGSALDDSTARKYTYFIVRGDGKYMVRVREGAETRTLVDWTSHDAIPRESGEGKAVYGITIDVDGDDAKVSVNGKPVTTISANDAPLHGVAGVRINHGLHVMVTPLAVTR